MSNRRSRYLISCIPLLSRSIRPRKKAGSTMVSSARDATVILAVSADTFSSPCTFLSANAIIVIRQSFTASYLGCSFSSTYWRISSSVIPETSAAASSCASSRACMASFKAAVSSSGPRYFCVIMPMDSSCIS